MNNLDKIVSRLVLSFEMTETEWKKYHKEHPNAEKRNHHIIPDPKVKHPSEIHKARRAAKARYFKEMKANHPNYCPIVKKHIIQHTIQHGTYSVISAGVNPEIPEDKMMADKDPEFIKKRTAALRNDLDKLGVKYTEVLGSYGGEEVSFLIAHDLDSKASQKQDDNKFMVHDYGKHGDIVRQLNKLGEKYNQDSVAHSKNGTMELHYTTGKNKGKRCSGEGTKFVSPTEEDSFTEARIGQTSYTKWAANMDRCFPGCKGFNENNFVDNPYK